MELTITELSKMTGFTVNHLTQLVRRGVLPPGRKEGQARLLPYNETMQVLVGHEPKKDWGKRKAKKRKTSAKGVTEPDWSKLL